MVFSTSSTGNPTKAAARTESTITCISQLASSNIEVITVEDKLILSSNSDRHSFVGPKIDVKNFAKSICDNQAAEITSRVIYCQRKKKTIAEQSEKDTPEKIRKGMQTSAQSHSMTSSSRRGTNIRNRNKRVSDSHFLNQYMIFHMILTLTFSNLKVQKKTE